MRYVRVETEGEARWINLEQVTRVTLARHAGNGNEILVVFFSNPDDECTLKIEGSSKKNVAAIRTLEASLDAATHPS